MVRNAFDSTFSGEPLKVHSREYNAFIKTSLAHASGLLNNSVPGSNDNTLMGVVDVKNVSGQVVSQYHYMVIEGFLFSPQDEEDSFKNAVTLKVNIYDESDPSHEDARMVILQEPLGIDAVGSAMTVGATQIRVNITDKSHQFARFDSGSDILQSSSGGPVGLIAKENALGENWAYGSFPVDSGLQQFKVKGLAKNDSITCVTWDGVNEGSNGIEIAMPYTLRRTPFEGNVWHGIGFTYQDFQKRTGSIGEDEQKLVILPLYEEGDIIYASKNVGGGNGVVDQVTLKDLKWLDVNADGRYWATDDSAEEEEVSV